MKIDTYSNLQKFRFQIFNLQLSTSNSFIFILRSWNIICNLHVQFVRLYLRTGIWNLKSKTDNWKISLLRGNWKSEMKARNGNLAKWKLELAIKKTEDFSRLKIETQNWHCKLKYTLSLSGLRTFSSYVFIIIIAQFVEILQSLILKLGDDVRRQ